PVSWGARLYPHRLEFRFRILIVGLVHKGVLAADIVSHGASNRVHLFQALREKRLPARPVSQSVQCRMAGIAQIPAHETDCIESWAVALLQPARGLFKGFLAHVVLP